MLGRQAQHLAAFALAVDGLVGPAAQAVLQAIAPWEVEPESYSREIAAEVLRAAALCCKRDAAILLSIADELDLN